MVTPRREANFPDFKFRLHLYEIKDFVLYFYFYRQIISKLKTDFNISRTSFVIFLRIELVLRKILWTYYTYRKYLTKWIQLKPENFRTESRMSASRKNGTIMLRFQDSSRVLTNAFADYQLLKPRGRPTKRPSHLAVSFHEPEATSAFLAPTNPISDYRLRHFALLIFIKMMSIIFSTSYNFVRFHKFFIVNRISYQKNNSLPTSKNEMIAQTLEKNSTIKSIETIPIFL